MPPYSLGLGSEAVLQVSQLLAVPGIGQSFSYDL